MEGLTRPWSASEAWTEGGAAAAATGAPEEWEWEEWGDYDAQEAQQHNNSIIFVIMV